MGASGPCDKNGITHLKTGTSTENLREKVKALALAVGFDLAGVAVAEPTPETRFLREWLARGYSGTMEYMARRVEERVDPRRVLEGARSVIAVGLVYAEKDGTGGAPDVRAPGTARVARYAGGDDYHEVMGDRLRTLVWGIEALAGRAVSSRHYVDTGPVQERVFAARGGLGWIGKNTCLIHPELGSYLFLGVVLTDLEIAPDESQPDHCGNCRLCLDACPTDALVAPYELDARRCIAHATIEDPGSIPPGQRADHGEWLFGCDICQEVCPWNRTAGAGLVDPLGLRERLRTREAWQGPTLQWVLELGPDAWREVTRRSALRRARHRGLLRNALVVAGNSGDRQLIPLVRKHAEGADSLLREHARWALERLEAAGA